MKVRLIAQIFGVLALFAAGAWVDAARSPARALGILACTFSVPTVAFGNVDIRSDFFDSFRADYGGTAFDRWFNRKADEPAYICYEGQDLVAFLYLKVEGPKETTATSNPDSRRTAGSRSVPSRSS